MARKQFLRVFFFSFLHSVNYHLYIIFFFCYFFEGWRPPTPRFIHHWYFIRKKIFYEIFLRGQKWCNTNTIYLQVVKTVSVMNIDAINRPTRRTRVLYDDTNNRKKTSYGEFFFFFLSEIAPSFINNITS